MGVIMKAPIRSLLFALFVLFVALPGAPSSAKDDPNSMKNCYHVRGEARYGALGYNHVVIVTNKCDLTLKCEVWTDVDPSPRIPLTVGPNATEEATCRINSPARGFKAFGECKKE